MPAIVTSMLVGKIAHNQQKQEPPGFRETTTNDVIRLDFSQSNNVPPFRITVLLTSLQ